MVTATSAQVVMRDDTALATSVWRPSTGRVPALLVRTPYDRSVLEAEGLEWARRGYAFIGQDVRGRYGSAGEWRPYEHETQDGLDTLTWLLAQPWCNGAVVVKGASYQAYAARALAATGHPAVRGLISAVPVTSHRKVAYSPDGALHLSGAAWWSRAHGIGPTSLVSAEEPQLRELFTSLRSLPVRDLWRELGVTREAWQHYLSPGPITHPAETDAPRVPVLGIGGWFDPFVSHTVDDHVSAPPQSAIVVGPWTHDLMPRARIGRRCIDVDGHDFGAHESRWLHGVLGNGPGVSPRVKLAVLGSGGWYEGDEWPATRARRWWLDLDCHLNHGVPERDGSSGFDYDPLHPVPSLLGPVDYRPVESRTDVLSWTTAPFERPISIVGSAVVRLFAGSTAPATDFVVHLTEVHPDGTSLHLTHGHATRRLRGAVAEVEIRLVPVGIRIPRGHRLRLLVSSSCFPYYRRALNTDEDWLTESRSERARQTIRSGPAFPSAVTVPVLDDVVLQRGSHATGRAPEKEDVA